MTEFSPDNQSIININIGGAALVATVGSIALLVVFMCSWIILVSEFQKWRNGCNFDVFCILCLFGVFSGQSVLLFKACIRHDEYTRDTDYSMIRSSVREYDFYEWQNTGFSPMVEAVTTDFWIIKDIVIF